MLDLIADMFRKRGPSVPPSSRLVELAEAGNGDAQEALGAFYFGTNREEDYELSLRWNEAAARKGCAAAQSRLATIYHEALGVEHNRQESIHWFMEAARRNHAGAQLMVGTAYDIGVGLPRDKVEAAKWFTLSKAKGDEIAHTMLNTVLGEFSEGERQRFREWLGPYLDRERFDDDD
jgi:TPR repeat protein